MVEVFKTNVQKAIQAKKIISQLNHHFPNSKINFDLEDCDKVLRVEGKNIAVGKVVELVEQNGFICAELE
jgi:hypothetical protein